MRVGMILCAAGSGKRMKLGMNKQFLELDGKPLIIHTLENILLAEQIQDIVVVAGQGDIERVEALLEQYCMTRILDVIHGGQERQESVFLGLKRYLQEEVQPDIVLVHDGARPFVQDLDFRHIIQLASDSGAAVFAVPVKDTIKRVSDHTVAETLNRSELWSVQTPQAFRFSSLIKAHEEAERKGWLGTDDASLIERMGGTVTVAYGSGNNIKLTTPEDITYAEFLLKRSIG